MRARQLEVFTAVMRVGTVTGAARVLNISQPALSQILMHAEDELGFKLFDREKGRLQPTAEALEIYPEAERLFSGLEGLRRKTADLRLGRAGLLRVAASPPAALSLLPKAMARFRETHPEVMVRTHVAPITSMIDMLRASDASVTFALDDALPPDIEVEKIAEASFVCLLPEHHPLTDRSTIDFSDLTEETIISFRSQTRPHDELLAAAKLCGVSFQPTIEFDASLAAAGYVSSGLGVAVVDSLLPWAGFKGLVVRPLTDAPKVPLSMLTLREKGLSLAESAFCDIVREAAPDFT